MSVASHCEVDSSLSRNSSDFCCTEEELFESFMEIVNDPELQGISNNQNQSEVSPDPKTNNNNGNNAMSDKEIDDSRMTIDGGVEENNTTAGDTGSEEHSSEVVLEDDGSKKVSTSPECSEKNNDLEKQLQECSDAQTNGNATENGVNDSTEKEVAMHDSADENVRGEEYEHCEENPKSADQDALVNSIESQNNISNSNTEAVNQCETTDQGLNSGIDGAALEPVQSPSTPSKGDVISSILVPQPSTKKKAKDKVSMSTKEPAKSPSKGDIISSIIVQQPSKKVKGAGSDHLPINSSEGTNPANQNEDISPANQNGEVSPSNQSEEEGPTNQSRDKEDGSANQSALQSIESDIEEGIRKANEVCEELNLITQRLSRSSDELLHDNDTEIAQNDNKGATDDTKTDNGDDVVIDEMQRPNSLPKLIVTNNSSDGTTPSSGGATPSPSVNPITVPPGSSPTQMVHLHGESLDRKSSVSDSIESSEGSSGDAKSLGATPSPTQDRGPINWEILNTAFDNPETDEDDAVYETSGHFGGFGLVLDEDESPTTTTDEEVRLRSVSQSTTVSEVEFQQEYRNSHSAASLERNPDGTLSSGYLYKLGGTGITPKNWRKRWCVVRQDRCLYYYKSARDKIPCGIVVLASYIVSHSSEHSKKHCIKLSKGGGRTYFFSSDSSKDMLRWMESLRHAAEDKDEGTSFLIRNEIIHNVAIPALSIKKPDCHGFLTKQGAKSRRSWKRRYCVLKNGCLYYYREMADTTALGVAKLHGYKVDEEEGNGRRNGFRCIPPQSGMRTFSFMADNEYDKKRWIPCFRESIGANTSSE